MKEHIFKKLLRHYSNHNSSEDENRLMESWYDSFDRDSQEAAPLGDRSKRRELRNAIYSDIQAKIDLPVREKTNTYRFTYLKIAASILLAGGAGLWLWYKAGFLSHSESTVPAYVTAGAGTMKKLVLPDSSEVWLNTESTLHYSWDFNHSTRREVVLDQGEAYFKVKHNPDRPFIVRAGELTTQVLGTSFNIRSYRELDEVRVAVLTGRVQVNSRNKLLGLLVPGQEIVYNKQTGIDFIHVVNPLESNGWISGRTYLSQASFAELALSLKNRYGIVLKAGSPKIEKLRFSIQLDQYTPIAYTIKAICSIHQTKYRKGQGNEIELY